MLLAEGLGRGLGILARMTILLRKFNVNIQSLDIKPLDNEQHFYEIKFILDSTKNPQAISLVMKKLERLIPVVTVKYEEIQES